MREFFFSRNCVQGVLHDVCFAAPTTIMTSTAIRTNSAEQNQLPSSNTFHQKTRDYHKNGLHHPDRHRGTKERMLIVDPGFLENDRAVVHGRVDASRLKCTEGMVRSVVTDTIDIKFYAPGILSMV